MAYGLTQSADLESGSSQYFSRADTASLSLTGDFTFEGWVKFESLPSSGNQMKFISKSTGGGTDDRAYQFYLLNNAGTLQLVIFTSSDGAGSTTDLKSVNWTPSTGVWYHVAVSADLAATSTYKFYVNGAQQGSDQNGTVASMSDTTAPFYIGVNGNISDAFFDGRMSLWRVWSIVRTQPQISGAMCTVFGTSTSNMAAEWSLDNVLTDASGNSNTLTNVNAVTFGADVTSTCIINATLAADQGAFAYTGFAVLVGFAHVLALAQGAYTLTGQALAFVLDLLWDNQSKSSSVMTNQSKSSSSWSNSTKNSSTFTNQNKS